MATKYTSKLKNKRVLVLGGTSGIGYCVAEAALEHGAIVVISGSREPKIDATIERYPCDLADADSTKVEESIKALFKCLEPKLSEVTAEQFYAMQRVRLLGSVQVAKHSTDHINISSTSSITFTDGINYHKPSPGFAITAGAGSGIDGLARGLAVDMKPVRVNCVAPGAILTEIWQNTFKTPEQMQKAMEQFASKNLVGGLGKPEDTAEAYIYFMKDMFVDGQTIITEGGYLLGI